MKTTIELADDLLLLAKQRALDQRTTLKALIESSLRRTLELTPEAPKGQQAYRIPVIRNALQAPADSDSDANVLIDAIRDERAGWVVPMDPAQ